MKIELFINDPTVNFNTPYGNEANVVPTSPAPGSWFGQMATLPPEVGFNEGTESAFLIREEPFGSLLLNRRTGEVYKLDKQATEATRLLIRGLEKEQVAKNLHIELEELDSVIMVLEQCH
ncbi:hypothetical protein J7E78_21285 [Paenibacillus polymyxa]|uniref:hypothetical protein n=1 Tax=Paenibacillus polymyxa TaxID=1406 RepID=UPI001BE863E2|nr:hypothetical protein [Paenibacillus polymyxa]MBT2286078.1 hypothetical protein [Paenibacillus polymyxa]